MTAPKKQPSLDEALDRVFAEGGDATVAFLLRLAADRKARLAKEAPTDERKAA